MGELVKRYNDLTITVYSSLTEFNTWWEQEAPPARFLVFQDPRVMVAWEKTRAPGINAQTFAIRVDDDNGDALFAMFLAIQNPNLLGERRLIFCDGGVCDYNAPIIFEPVRPLSVPIEDLWRRIRAALPAHDTVHLQKMVPTVKGAANPLWDLGVQDHPDSGHTMDLPADWGTLESIKRNQGQIKTWLRRARQLNKVGTVSIITPKSEEESLQTLDLMFKNKKQWLHNTEKDDPFEDPSVIEFYRECEKLSKFGLVQLTSLIIDDTILATNFSFVDKEELINVISSFTPGEWEHYSCGAVHLQMTIRLAIEQGLHVFNFGYGDATYKLLWCDGHIPLRDVEQYIGLRERTIDALHMLKCKTFHRVRARALPRDVAAVL